MPPNARHLILPRRPFGSKARHTTVLGLGGAALGDLFERLPEEQADGAVRAAFDAGVTYFDTAPFYGHGLSEHRIGRALRQVDRERVMVSTKVGRLYRRPADRSSYSTGVWAGGLHFEFKFDYSRAGVLRSYEDSLFRLGLNRVDCLVIHDLDHRFHSEEILSHHRHDLETGGWAALEELRRTGEIYAIGVGINDCALMDYFLARFDMDFFLVAMPYSLLDQSAGRTEFLECLKRGIQIVKGSPFASGILATGPVPGAVYDYAPATVEIVTKTHRLLEVCYRLGVSMQAAALQFPLAHTAVRTVIPGATSRAIVETNVAHLHTVIPTAVWDELKTEGLLLPDVPVPQSHYG
jgi:D-threo-aldose 1-dehydrogenase